MPLRQEHNKPSFKQLGKQFMSEEKQGLTHMVYFTLKDNSPESLVNFLSACQKYLSDHPGVLYYSVGPRAAAYNRPVNDSDFDVALNLVFETEADHDTYQSSERHQQFLAEQSENWSQVRIFDTLV